MYYQQYKRKKMVNKKICRYCNSLYYKTDKYSAEQWQARKYCNNKCAGDAKRKHIDNKAKQQAWRRQKGVLEKGTEELARLISLKTKEAMQREEVQKKIRQPRLPLTDKQKNLLSQLNRGKMPLNMQYKQYGNIKNGYYQVDGQDIYFRSKWEANYALFLDYLEKHNQIKSWQFEAERFYFDKIQRGTTTYLPDFKIVNNDDSIEYHEVKGYMDSKSKTKIKRMAKYYPEIKLVIIDKHIYNDILKKIPISFY